MTDHLIILAGGKGERLWPISTQDTPKQFLQNFSQKSLFQQTLSRHEGLFQSVYILSQEKYFFILLDQMQECKELNTFFLEPFGRGTLPILTLALLQMGTKDRFLMTPSDLEIEPLLAYQEFVQEVIASIATKKIILVGKEPTFPHSGFGYIRHLNKKVHSFIEKPKEEIARQLIAEKDVLWNCGMIFAEVGSFLQLIEKNEPQLFANCKLVHKLAKKKNFQFETFRFDEKLYFNLESKSIDCAILENAQDLFVEPVRFEWQDCGTFQNFFKEKSPHNKLKLMNAQNISIQGTEKEVIVQNLSDIAIIENEKQIFVLRR